MASATFKVKCPKCKEAHVYTIEVRDSLINWRVNKPCIGFGSGRSRKSMSRMGLVHSGIREEWKKNIRVIVDKDAPQLFKGSAELTHFRHHKLDVRESVNRRISIHRGSSNSQVGVSFSQTVMDGKSIKITRVFTCPKTGEDFQATIIIGQ